MNPTIQPAPSHSIPSLDGLRAVSIALVILSHSTAELSLAAQQTTLVRLAAPFASLGVEVFFVISGFLITRLLLAEQERRRTIRLGRFYRRRALRIFPAAYAYLAALALLWAFGLVPERMGSLLSAATYTWNYYPAAQGWPLAHFWTLCLEEQFYLLWPAALNLLGRRRAALAAAAVVLLSPASRVATYFLWPAMRSHVGIMLHTRFDTILVGCLLALAWDDARLQSALRRLFRPSLLAAAAALLLVASPALSLRFHGGYDDIVGYSLNAFLIALLMSYCILRPASPVGRLLNTRALVHLGVLSYSLYLWQQICFGPGELAFPWSLLAALAAAELSLRCIERPTLRWRERLESRAAVRAAAAG